MSTNLPPPGPLTYEGQVVTPNIVRMTDPTTSNNGFPVPTIWINYNTKKAWLLVSVALGIADWVPIGGNPGEVDSITVDTFTAPGTDPVLPDPAGNITITGGQVAAGTTANVIQTDSLAANAFTIQIQRSQAVATSTVEDNGVCHFDDSSFNVDTNGFVTLKGGSAAIDSVEVDTFTAPGTNPVVPDVAGLITVTGGQVAAGTTANVIRTDSLAANEYTIQVQRSQTASTSTVADNGVCHFSSYDFLVDADGFTSLNPKTPYSVLCAGTGTGQAIQPVASLGTVGQVLTSNGPGSLPTWQNGGGGSGAVQQVEIFNNTPQSNVSPSAFTNGAIPQNTEGLEVLSLSITPTSATNILVVEAQVALASNSRMYAALFMGSGASAVTVSSGATRDGFAAPICILYFVTAGTTNPITFAVRAGDTTGNPFSYNVDIPFTVDKVQGYSSCMTITEYGPAGGGGGTETFTVDGFTAPGTNPVAPNGSSNITITGGQVAAGTTANVIKTESLALNTYTIEVQRATTAASSTLADNGVCHFNSSDFTIDSNGFVSSIGGGFSREVGVDVHTAPGTSPVLPTSGGLITVTGGQVAAGTTANVIQTDSLAANTYTIQVQRTAAVGTSTVGSNGVCHFNSTDFTVDSNGFVSSIGGGFARFVEVDTYTAPGTNPVAPATGGIITVTGGQVPAGTTANAIRTDSLAANTYAIQIQRSQAVAGSTVADNGICHFNSADFTVDANGFVSTIGGGGGGAGIFTVDAHTSPGTSPVTADGSSNITITGGQVAAGTTANVIQTDSLAPHAYTIQIQRSTTAASSTAADNGVCHFNSADFTIDSNGFVSSIGGGFSREVGVDTYTAPGTSPVVPNSGGLITVTGGQVAAGTTANVIQTDSLAANTYAIQVQRSQATAVSTIADNGVCHFNAAHFNVDANGWVSGGGSGGGISEVNVQVFTTSGTYTPTSGMVYCWAQLVGGGGGGGGASVDGGAVSPAGSGGGAGLYASKVFSSATIGTSQTITVGAGGAGGIAAADGSSGTATSIGALLSVDGGVNGQYMRTSGPVQEGGDGGQASTGTYDYASFGGGGGYAINVGGAVVSGAGGASLLSPGGKARGVAADGVPGGGYGGGGSGGVAAVGVPATGGAGDNGVVIITEYIV